MLDAIICLSLDKRQDLWMGLKRQAENIFDVPFYNFVAGDGKSNLEYHHVDVPLEKPWEWGYGQPAHKVNHYNAFLCHQKMLKWMFDDLGYTNVLFVEDDSYFLPNRTKSVMNLPLLSELEFDLLYLGWWIGDENDSFNTIMETHKNQCDIFRNNGMFQVGGLHGVVINRGFVPTLKSLKPNNPIDCQLNHIRQQDPNFIEDFLCFPKCMHIRTTYSYCEGSVISRKTLEDFND